MAFLRDLLWSYPQLIISLVSRLRFLFTVIFGMAFGVLLLLGVWGVSRSKVNRAIFDGTLHIGVVSTFTAINPLDVGSSETEKIIAKLLFNGLISIDESGRMYPELADTWEVSPDGKTYTFFLKKNIKWHDGVELTAKDVASTFALLQSSKSGNLGAIAEKVKVSVGGPYEISFTLPQPNAAFLELMTLPILPDHIYKNMTFGRITELGDSLTPIGTGPYQFVSHKGNNTVVVANQQYFKGAPRIPSVTIAHFASYETAQKAFLKGDIHVLTPLEGASLQDMMSHISESSHIKISAIPQSNNMRLVFFNVKKKADATEAQQSLAILNDVRLAFSYAVNRADISLLIPFSRPAYGPYDTSSYIYSAESVAAYGFSLSKANETLEKAGWKYANPGALYRTKGDNELRLTLTYLQTDINQTIASQLKRQAEQVGINLSLRAVTGDELQQSILSLRDFELLLFEVQTGVDPDQYGLWHSSQAAFPGLNLGGFSSSVVDNLLEKGRLQLNRDKRITVYTDLQKQLLKDVPALFLYHPAQIEVYFDIINRQLPDSVVDVTDRYSSIHEWTLVPGWRNWQTR